MSDVSRRQILQILGAGAVGVGCGAADDTAPDQPAVPGDTSTPAPTPGAPPDETGTTDPPAVTATPAQMLAEIETFVVVMMENRSFDHYFGALQRDATYANRAAVEGTTGKETNPAPGGGKVKVYNTKNYTLANPPHSFAACHEQYDGGKNDKFVIAHEGKNQKEVMAFYERSQIPFYYWLADNFTLCDGWHASVLGPTWPNRFYLHAGTSAGKKNNTPILEDAPSTIWEQMKAAGKTATNYYAGKGSFFPAAFPTKIAAGVKPMKKIGAFFDDAKAGKLPNLAFVDPDHHVSDDHPAHDIRLGQAFVASIYKALAASPQWNKCLLIVIYDEHGGFWDHVPPKKAPDDDPDFRRFGFRVPALIAGPTVKQGYLSKTMYDHTSVLATLTERFGLKGFTTRSAKANTIVDVFDVAKYQKPTAAPMNPPTIKMDAAALATIGHNSQPEIEEAIERGAIPPELVDDRPLDERVRTWLRSAEELGAIRFVR